MATFNWERASQRSRMYEGMGYLDRVAAADEGWDERECERELRLDATRNKREAKARVGTLTKAEKRALGEEARKLGVVLSRHPELKLQKLFSQLAVEARSLKIDQSVLRRRRLLALNAGHGATAIIEAGKLEGPIGPGALRKDSTSATRRKKRKPPGARTQKPPISTKERMKQDAAAKGVSIHEVANTRSVDRPSQPAIKSRGAAPPVPTGGRASPSRAKPPKPVKTKASKAERDQKTATRRGITVAQLTAERQATAAADRELAAEAKRLGITAKELRQKRKSTS